MQIKITAATTSNPPGRLAEAEIHFPTFTDEQRANLQTVAALVYGPTQTEAHALQDAARAALALEGLKLIGFAVWERRGGTGRNVTFPARQYSINGERRSFALLRPTTDPHANERIRDLILAGYQQHLDEQNQPALVHWFDFRGQAACGSSNHEDNDAPATNDPAAVTCPRCKDRIPPTVATPATQNRETAAALF